MQIVTSLVLGSICIIIVINDLQIYMYNGQWERCGVRNILGSLVVPVFRSLFPPLTVQVKVCILSYGQSVFDD